METRVHRVFTGLSESTAPESTGVQLYNLTTGAINLTDRQIGFYDADTLLSLDATSAGAFTSESGKVIVAMGYDSTGNGTVDTVIKSLPIDISRIVKLDKQPYICPKNPIKRFTWTTTDCDTEYCLKFSTESVQISEYLGFNVLDKTFSVTTDCCEDGCDTCGGGSCSALATLLVDAINADKDEIFTATAQTQNDLLLEATDISSYDPTDYAVVTAGGHTFYFDQGDYTGDATGDATELQTELQAFIDAYNLGGTVTVTRQGSQDYDIAVAGSYITSINFDPSGEDDTTTATATTNGCPSIYVEASAPAIANFCHLPINLVEANGYIFNIYGDCAFDCNLTVSDVQDMQYEEGNGIVVKDMEEEAAAYSGELYRFTKLIQPDPVRTLLTDVTKNHAVYVIEHDDLHKGAPSGHFFRSRWKTIIAVPTGTVNCNTESVADSTLEAALDTYFGT